MATYAIQKTTFDNIDKPLQELHGEIYELLEKERQSNPGSYTQFDNAKGRPYQAYERIQFDGLRWSVEKRIKEYGLERYLQPAASVLDIGSNYGFFVTEFALSTAQAHGIEPIEELNDIGRITAEHLGVADKTKFFTDTFEEFEAPCAYDTIFSLASFYTSDKNQRGSAETFFAKVRDMLKEDGEFFYESTSFQREEGSETYDHYLKAQEALEVLKELFDVYKDYEAPSGSTSHRIYARCRKK